MEKQKKSNTQMKMPLRSSVLVAFLLLFSIAIFSYFNFQNCRTMNEQAGVQAENGIKVLSVQTDKRVNVDHKSYEQTAQTKKEPNFDEDDMAAKTELPDFPTARPEAKKTDSCRWRDMIVIEKINVQAPIIWSQGKTEEDFQQDMRKGVIHFPATVMPGQMGNIFITGHSTYYESDPGKYKNVFIRLGELKIGDRITIITDCENNYEYEVFHIEPVLPDDQRIFDVRNRQEKILTLATCWPIGSYETRLMVKALQVE